MTLPLFGNPFNPAIVVSGWLAVPTRRYSYPRRRLTLICCFCQQGVNVASTDLELPLGLLDQQARGERVCVRVHRVGVSDTVSLVADRPPPEAVRNRSVPTRPFSLLWS